MRNSLGDVRTNVPRGASHVSNNSPSPYLFVTRRGGSQVGALFPGDSWPREYDGEWDPCEPYEGSGREDSVAKGVWGEAGIKTNGPPALRAGEPCRMDQRCPDGCYG